jgi:hypothetical protein
LVADSGQFREGAEEQAMFRFELCTHQSISSRRLGNG